jgi:hypothetical protein
MERATEGSTASPAGERSDRHVVVSTVYGGRQKNLITGHINLHSSLCHILANCKDFQEEETALEHLGT